MSTGISTHPSTAPSTHHTHHWRMGPLPRIAVIATIIVNIPVQIWASASNSGYFGGSWGTVIWTLPGLLLVWAAKPTEEHRQRIAAMWMTVIGYVASLVGGCMIAWAYGTHAALLAHSEGPGVPIMIAGDLLFLIAGIATLIIYALTNSEESYE